MRDIEHNPDGIRSVTVIVTHEDDGKDFSKTFTADQILNTASVDATQFERHTRTEWFMTTLEER